MMRTKLLAFSIVVLGIMSSGLHAGYTVMLKTTNGSGGPYSVDFNYDMATFQEDFKTFCVEYDDTYLPGIVYSATIDDKVLYSPSPDSDGNEMTLNNTTKKLYAAYLNNSIGLGVKSGAYYDLQEAIWMAQGYTVSGATISDANIARLLSGDDTGFTISGWRNVKVLNLWTWDSNGTYDYSTSASADRQSQLIMTTVPAPGAFLLALLGVSAARRFRTKK